MYSSHSSRSASATAAVPLALQVPEADRESGASRRRRMAMLKYGSGSSNSNHKRSTMRMHKAREHTKQLAQKSITMNPSSEFADFGSAFGAGKRHNSPRRNRAKAAVPHAQDPPRFSLFDEDPFSKPMSETDLTESSSEFQADWPKEAQSMSTMPANSSMQTSFVQHTQPQQPKSSSRPHHTVHTPERRSAPISTSPSPSYGSGGGAAARRRMRNQMRKPGLHRSDTDPQQYLQQQYQQQQQQQTPPQSPYSIKRYHSSDSVGSASATRPGKPTDHLANYTVAHQRKEQQFANISSNRSVGSNATPTRSVTSSNSSSAEVNLFENENGAGFTFDAFGLDASQMNREVMDAMHEIAGAHPDLSFFLDRDPLDDDFGANRGWESSPAASRSSTPDPHQQQKLNHDDEDGFVDGFRVTKSMPMSLPVHVRQSPTSEKSSLTSSSSDPHHGGERRNLFKEKASQKKYRIVRPGQAEELMTSPVVQQKQQQQSQNWPSLPDLEDERPGPMPKRRDQDSFFGAGEVVLAPSTKNKIDNTGRSPRRQSMSDTGAPSDVGVASEYAASDRDKEMGANLLAQLKEAQQTRKQQHQQQQVEEDVVAHEEKKLEDEDRHSRHEIESEKSPGVTNFRSQWQKRDALLRFNEEPKQPPANRTSSQPSRELRQPTQIRQQQQASSISATSSSERFLPIADKNSRDYANKVTKSEAGGLSSLRISNSQVNSLLYTSLQKNDSMRDAQSDVGGTTPSSPAFANIKLRRTGYNNNLKESPRHQDALAIERERQRERIRRQGHGSDAKEDTATTASTTSTRSPDYGFHDEEQINNNQSHEEQQATEEEPSRPKYTYRELREMELEKEREEEEARVASQRAAEPPQRDVAALIRRRIAATKSGEPETDTYQQQATTSPTLSAFEVPRIRRIEEQPTRVSSGHVEQQQQQQTPNDNNIFRVVQSDLVIETRSSPRPQRTTPVPSAVSRLHMLQIQHSLSEDKESELAPAAPTGNSSNDYRPETPEPQTGDELHDKHHRATTPKATMMMLNAFLAGRDSLLAGDSVRGSNSDDRREKEHGEKAESGVGAQDMLNNRLPALKDDPKYERYFTMLKIGMPMDVVKHAMTRDGLDPSVMDGDHNKPVGVPLKHDPLYAKYFKMHSFGLPMEAVKHAMERDGLDSTVMDQDHDLPVLKPRTDNEEPKEQDSHRRARLHWKPLRKVTSNSLWARIDEDEELGNLEIDEEEFQELFQVERNLESLPKSGSINFGPKRGAVRVIDAKRANNGGIILARLKMSHDDMADAVDGINENALTAEQIENIIEYLPTKDERKALEAYMLEGGQDAAEKFDALCECEKFMVSMMTVKHAKRKVRALLFKLQFQSCLEDIHSDTIAVEASCDELCNSVRLRQLLGIVLTFGNRLNTAGNGQRKAGAFTLDSLLKLNQAKAFDKKTTFLHYIVLIVQRNNELLLRFKDDIPTVFKCDKIYFDQCVSDLEEVENQLENVRKIALHQARHAVGYRFRRTKKQDDEMSLSDGEASLSLEDEVEALRATPVGLFTLSAIKLVSSLRDRVEETKAKFSRLLEYFGEEEGHMQPHDLFNVIGAFSRDFDKAVEQVSANQKLKQREERKRQAKGKIPAGRPPTYSPAQPDRKASNPMIKASNHQPSMSNIFKEIKTLLPPQAPTPDPGTSLSIQPTASQNRTHVPTAQESSSPYQQAPSDEHLDETFESSDPYPTESMEPHSIISTFEEMHPPVQQRSRSSVINGDRPVRPGQDAVVSSKEVVSPSKAACHSSSSSKAKAALRQKARMRRQRFIGERSSSSPSAMSPPTVQAVSPSPWTDDAEDLHNDNNNLNVPTLHPNDVRMYSRSPSADDAGAHAVTPRSSMRNRMEQRKQRRPTASPGIQS